jgi:ketosteroid isomerase-like protein
VTDNAQSGADRHLIRDLVETYAAAVDHVDSAAVASLFTPEGALELWPDPDLTEPQVVRRGTTEIVRAIDFMATYVATIHEIANHSSEVAGDNARASTRCMAHHVSGEAGSRTDLVLAIDYVDTLRRVDNQWRFVVREVRTLWQSTLEVDA